MDWKENIDYYFNSQGNMVLTADYLLKRAYCCGNGCLHCPYQYQQVPEPNRSFLLEQRAKNEKKDKS